MEPDDHRSGTYGRGEGGRDWRDPGGSAPRGLLKLCDPERCGRSIYH